MIGDFAPAEGPRWVELHGGEFIMGSEDFYDDEAPTRIARVEPFAIGLTPVTNRQFTTFVSSTGYVTVAEREQGSLVFTPTSGPVDLRDWRQWWRWEQRANWRHPRGVGLGPSAKDLPDHPVVQIAYADAHAYADWADARLPTEKELSMLPVAASAPHPTRGAALEISTARSWRTRGMGSFLTSIEAQTGGSEQARSVPSRPTVTVCSIASETCGSGRAPTMTRSHPLRQRARAALTPRTLAPKLVLTHQSHRWRLDGC